VSEASYGGRARIKTARICEEVDELEAVSPRKWNHGSDRRRKGVDALEDFLEFICIRVVNEIPREVIERRGRWVALVVIGVIASRCVV
jgi:hypothetical protein